MNASRLITPVLLAAAIVSAIAAQSSVGREPCGNLRSSAVPYRFDRESKSDADLNDFRDVSGAVLERVENQLRSRVGLTFFDNLRFSHVAGIDFDKDSKLSLNDLDRIDAYEFTLEVKPGVNDAYSFAFAIGTDRTGRFLSEAGLPNIADNPEKGILRPCNEAVEMANQSELLRNARSTFVQLTFDAANGVFAWDVYVYTNGLHSSHVLLNANSLDTLRTFDRHEAF